MSAVLVVTKNKKQIGRVNVSGAKFTIGRGNQADYPIDEELASRKHVEITFDEGQFWVQDLQSTNGTRLNGDKLTQRTRLKDGDEITVGSTSLRFLSDVVRAGSEGEDDLTRPAGGQLPAPPGAAAPAPQEEETGPLRVKVKISGGPLDGGVFKNWPNPLTIGRGLENNVVLQDNAVSTRHARIVREGEGYFIEDLDSANGTFLNGVKVRRQQLVNGNKIKVGVSTLLFELVDLRQRRRLLKIGGLSLAGLILLLAAVKLLQPPDIAGKHIERARQLSGRGELEKALDAYQAALKVEPNRAEAKQEATKIRAALDAKRLLQTAEKDAEEEKYDQAKELVYKVLRDSPKNARALELESVVKSIENATVAVKARNWADAVALLEKAREKYPKSALISARLDGAQQELMAERTLARGKEAFDHHQGDVAEGLLKIIPASSVYYSEAREVLDKVDRERKTAGWLQKAQDHYRTGQLTDALADIEQGLQAAPGDSALTDLRTRVRKLELLQPALAQAGALPASADLEALLNARAACDQVLAAEPDPLNELRKKAADAKVGLDQSLHSISQKFASQAAAVTGPGQAKETLRLYNLAVKADPANQPAVTAAAKIRQDLLRECKKLYGEGLRFEELEQKELAQERFRKVLEIAPPDDDYYKKASAKVR
jgi:pSer/pThr/pTyr-binding forkhead associated (FHA) protein